MRILLVDDDPSMRAVIKRILLRQFAVEIVECSNGLEALELLTQHRFGVVILDYTMPVLNGLDTLRALRESPSLSRIPVIMMTAVSDAGTVQRVVEYGVAEYLLKPLRPGQLVERVSRLIMASEQSDVPARSQGSPVFQPVELSSHSSVLIADGSPEFRQFFRRQISRFCQVREAGSGLVAFRSCLSDPPAALFVGSDLDVLSGELLAQQIRRTPRTDAIRLIGVMPPHLLRRVKKGSSYEAVILRTFIADLFNDGFETLLRRPGRLSGLLAGVPDLKLVGIAAFEEALGSTLQAAAVPRVPKTKDNPKNASAEVTMLIGKERTPLLIQLSIAQKQLKRLADLIEAEGDASPNEAPLMKLLERVARSTLREFTDRALEVEAGEVRARSASAQRLAQQPDDAISIEFDVAGKGLCFRLDLSLADEQIDCRLMDRP